MLILVDQDGVLADFERAFLDRWRQERPEAFYVPLEERRVFYMRDEYPEELREAMHSVHTSEGFYRDLPPIHGAVDALQEMLSAGHEVYICTSPLTSSKYCASEKLEWVHEHLGKPWLKRTIISPDKTLVGTPGSLLIDDRDRVEGVISPPPWTHVVFDAPYNREVAGPRLQRWSRWREELDGLLGR